MYTAPLGTLSSGLLKWQRLVDTPCGGPAVVGLNNKYLLVLGEDGVYTFNSTATTWMTTANVPVKAPHDIMNSWLHFPENKYNQFCNHH